MGFWSALGKIAPFAAMAIPGVGPALGLGAKAIGAASGIAGGLGAVAGNVGRTAGEASLGAETQRQTDAQINLGRDRTALDRARLGIEAPLARTKQAAYGDALQNVQDVDLNFAPTSGALPKFGVTGGVRPSLFGANARQAGGELGRQALLALMSGSDVPDLSPPTKPGGLENVLDKTGLAGSIWGAISEGLKKRPPIATMPPQPPLATPPFNPRSSGLNPTASWKTY